jgi:hypothetical protein
MRRHVRRSGSAGPGLRAPARRLGPGPRCRCLRGSGRGRVIGGYQQGGNTPSVSYSVRFGRAVEALYETAVTDN